MIYECGHDEDMGVGELCFTCHKAGIVLPPKPKPKAKIGRPKIYSKQERIERAKQWHIDNPRTEYHRKRSRDLKGVVKAPHVIYLESEDKFKRRAVSGSSLIWDSFSLCHTYSSLKMAQMACDKSGKGVVMARLGTKRETISNYKTNGLKG